MCQLVQCTKTAIAICKKGQHDFVHETCYVGQSEKTVGHRKNAIFQWNFPFQFCSTMLLASQFGSFRSGILACQHVRVKRTCILLSDTCGREYLLERTDRDLFIFAWHFLNYPKHFSVTFHIFWNYILRVRA